MRMPLELREWLTREAERRMTEARERDYHRTITAADVAIDCIQQARTRARFKRLNG
jgi:hypothetical protein